MSLLLDKIWRADPNRYDYDNEINFIDHTLTLYGGQTTHLMCGFVPSITLELGDENVIEKGILTLRYTIIENDTTEYWKCCPTFTENDFRLIHYTIQQEDGVYVVDFDANPMPTPEEHTNSLFTYLNSNAYCKTRYVNLRNGNLSIK